MADVLRRLSRPLSAQQQAAAVSPVLVSPASASARAAQTLPLATALAPSTLPLGSRLSFAAAPATAPSTRIPGCRSPPLRRLSFRFSRRAALHARAGISRDPSVPAECAGRRAPASLVTFRQRRGCHAQAHESAASEVSRNSAAEAAGGGSAERRDGGAAEAAEGAGSVQGEPFVVLNFYHFADVAEPHGDVERHLAFLQDRDIRGRIYMSHQGINAQLSGPASHVLEYADWVRSDPRFALVPLQLSPSPIGHAFPRLRLRYKPALVQVSGGMQQLSSDLCAATPLSPAEWRRKIEAMERGEREGDSGEEGEKRHEGRQGEAAECTKKILLLDVRNGYEWDVGHFAGAVRPPVDNFRSTEFGLHEEDVGATTALQQQHQQQQQGEEEVEDPLSVADKEDTEVLMYCTGGIRCDVYSALLRQQGYKRLYTLEGGVARYMREEGGKHWNGRLFVFDSRLAVPPRDYQVGGKVLQVVEEEGLERVGEVVGGVMGMGLGEGEEEEERVGCQMCGGPLEEVKHRNCANSDCNALILVCAACAHAMKGACSAECACAPRLRPFLARPEPYQRLHTYLPSAPPPRPPGYVSRRALKRRARKARRLAEAARGQATGEGREMEVTA
ncbi:hypothetical protein CLOM_g20559 [Closterium sp. NIES-68]|nr:hypothetical protein CLOM_g20559 [Closterium sp. NIES-68]GJP83571.1 hypothetical protein CLOP_g13705 [Closterium sp. NIES-67]